MKLSRKILLTIILVLAFLPSASPAFGGPPSEEEIHSVLTCAESLFKAERAREYAEIWRWLTARTKQSIVDAVYRESKKARSEVSKEKITADFERGGVLAKAYWDGYLFVFKPDMVLEESQWTIGAIRKDEAAINILYRKSEKPAVLKLFKEGSGWKVGLNETFGARNMTPFY